MAAVRQKRLVLDDTIWFVISVLEDHPGVSVEKMTEISRQVSGMSDREAKRARILELAEGL